MTSTVLQREARRTNAAASAPRSDDESRRLLALASQHVAKGASSSMRVLDYQLPLVIDRADGPYIWDADGNEIVDMNMGYGPLLFGHRPDFVSDAITDELARRGTQLGFPETLSIEAAALIKKSFPSIELLRFTSTGTEAAQTAVRLARAYTGRQKLILFEGHYHGSSDATFHLCHADPRQLRDAGGAAIPGTGGMGGAPRDAIVVPFNDPAELERAFDSNAGEIAAVMLEPASSNAGVIPPDEGYLAEVRRLADLHGALVIFDEVVTGFRIALGGAQERYGVPADITMLSKAVAGGVPLGVVGGRRDIMNLLVDDTVFHGGVYSGNPLCLAATVAVQQEYERNGDAIYRGLEEGGARLERGLRALLAKAGISAVVQRIGPMLSLWLTRGSAGAPRSYRDIVAMADHEAFVQLQHAAQRVGLYFHPNHFEPWYLSTTHTPAVIDEALDRFARALEIARFGNG